MTTPSLNERVAVEVMGWTWREVPPHNYYDASHWEGDKVGRVADEWNPEHSVADAFEALEHWRARKHSRSWRIYAPQSTYQVFECVADENYNIQVATDESLPKAICLALLAAVEGQGRG